MGDKVLRGNNRRFFHLSAAERETLVDVLAEALRARPDVAFAYAHGSFLTERAFHDVDMGVYLTEEAETGWERAMTLAEALEGALASSRDVDVAPPVDVRILNVAPVGFSYQVLLRGRLVFSRDEALRAEWVAGVVGRYLDLRPLRMQALKEAMTA